MSKNIRKTWLNLSYLAHSAPKVIKRLYFYKCVSKDEMSPSRHCPGRTDCMPQHVGDKLTQFQLPSSHNLPNSHHHEDLVS